MSRKNAFIALVTNPSTDAATARDAAMGESSRVGGHGLVAAIEVQQLEATRGLLEVVDWREYGQDLLNLLIPHNTPQSAEIAELLLEHRPRVPLEYLWEAVEKRNDRLARVTAPYVELNYYAATTLSKMISFNCLSSVEWMCQQFPQHLRAGCKRMTRLPSDDMIDLLVGHMKSHEVDTLVNFFASLQGGPSQAQFHQIAERFRARAQRKNLAGEVPNFLSPVFDGPRRKM